MRCQTLVLNWTVPISGGSHSFCVRIPRKSAKNLPVRHWHQNSWVDQGPFLKTEHIIAGGSGTDETGMSQCSTCYSAVGDLQFWSFDRSSEAKQRCSAGPKKRTVRSFESIAELLWDPPPGRVFFFRILEKCFVSWFLQRGWTFSLWF